MLETHPFGNFVPPYPKYLLLGSFATKPTEDYQWYYSNGRNHFWPILQEVYSLTLQTKSQKQKLFTTLNLAVADIIYSCKRLDNSNLDNKLTDIAYNKSINDIINKNKIQKIYFTSRFVETNFKRHFSNVAQEYSAENLVYLPSPSPRYAAMSKNDKISRYKSLLPPLVLQ